MSSAKQTENSNKKIKKKTQNVKRKNKNKHRARVNESLPPFVAYHYPSIQTSKREKEKYFGFETHSEKEGNRN